MKAFNTLKFKKKKVHTIKEVDLKKVKTNLQKAEFIKKETLRVKGVIARQVKRDRKK